MLKASLLQMLSVAEACGLTRLDEVNGKLYLKDLSIKEVYEVMQCVK